MIKTKKMWVFLIVPVFLLILAWYFLLGPSDNKPGSFYNKRENAVWLEHEWADQPKSPADIGRLVNQLAEHDIRYVFLHVGPLESDGTIPPERYLFTQQFLQTARGYGDRMQFLAWVGQLRGKIPFRNSLVRAKIVETVRHLTANIGFDGVHYDIEPLFDEDTDFLFLLEETREAISREKIISVALRELVPYFTGRILSHFLDLDSFNHPSFYQKIAERSDQLAIMTYENSIRKPWLYRYFVKNEVIWLTRLLPDTKILIGLPTYDQPTLTFYPEAENIENGLRGLIDGLNNWRSRKENFLGVALYRFATTDDAEWNQYRTLYASHFSQ